MSTLCVDCPDIDRRSPDQLSEHEVRHRQSSMASTPGSIAGGPFNVEGGRRTRAAPVATQSKSVAPAPKAKAVSAPVVTLRAVFEQLGKTYALRKKQAQPAGGLRSGDDHAPQVRRSGAHKRTGPSSRSEFRPPARAAIPRPARPFRSRPVRKWRFGWRRRSRKRSRQPAQRF